MANIIATTQIGITVLCLYPTPNGRYAPFGWYAKDGFIQWNKLKEKINKKTANGTL